MKKVYEEYTESKDRRPLKLYTMAQIELNGLKSSHATKAKTLLKDYFNVPEVYLNKLNYSHYVDKEEDLAAYYKNRRNLYFEVKAALTPEIKNIKESKWVKVFEKAGREAYYKFISDTHTKVKHLKVQEPWDHLAAFLNLSPDLQQSVNELDIITTKEIKSSDAIGTIVSAFPYCQILSFRTRNVSDFTKICQFMVNQKIELITKIYKVQYNHDMIAHTVLHGQDTEFEIFINTLEGSNLYKIKCESFSILVWRDMNIHGEKYLHDDANPFYLFNDNYGVVLKGSIEMEPISEYSVRNMIPQWYEAGTLIRVYKNKVTHEFR